MSSPKWKGPVEEEAELRAARAALLGVLVARDYALPSLEPSPRPRKKVPRAAPARVVTVSASGGGFRAIVVAIGLVVASVPGALFASCAPVALPDVGRVVAPLLCPRDYRASTVRTSSVTERGRTSESWVLLCATPRSIVEVPPWQSHGLLGGAFALGLVAAVWQWIKSRRPAAARA